MLIFKKWTKIKQDKQLQRWKDDHIVEQKNID